jgi:hypothetical protein
MRLATLTDVMYAVALVLIISCLPLPEESHAKGVIWIADLWAERGDNIIEVIIRLVFSIMYWIRSNTLMTALDPTDAAVPRPAVWIWGIFLRGGANVTAK